MMGQHSGPLGADVAVTHILVVAAADNRDQTWKLNEFEPLD
jgi:hypothetical protein